MKKIKLKRYAFYFLKSPLRIIILILVSTLFLFAYFFIYRQFNTISFKPAPILVSVEKVKRITLQHTFSFVGTLKSKNAIHIVSEKEGVIQSIHFKSDQHVEKNTLLITLKHDAQKAALEKAEAAYDDITDQYQRALVLYSKGLLAKTDMMQLKFKQKEAKADWAQACNAYHQCFIRAPFSGQLGIRQINLGEYITIGEPIVNLNSTPTLYVDFSVPASVGNELIKGMPLSITASHTVLTGKIVAIDSSMDSIARTINIRARLKPSSNTFKPGTFVNISLNINTQQNVLVVPNIAVDYTPYGTSVYVVNHKQAQLKYIQIKESQNDQFIISSGLNEDDIVVTAGQNKLHDGDPVQVEPTP